MLSKLSTLYAAVFAATQALRVNRGQTGV